MDGPLKVGDMVVRAAFFSLATIVIVFPVVLYIIRYTSSTLCNEEHEIPLRMTISMPTINLEFSKGLVDDDDDDDLSILVIVKRLRVTVVCSNVLDTTFCFSKVRPRLLFLEYLSLLGFGILMTTSVEDDDMDDDDDDMDDDGGTLVVVVVVVVVADKVDEDPFIG